MKKNRRNRVVPVDVAGPERLAGADNRVDGTRGHLSARRPKPLPNGRGQMVQCDTVLTALPPRKWMKEDSGGRDV